MHKQTAVWIDHSEARLFPISSPGKDRELVTVSLERHPHKHPRGPEGRKARPEDQKRFFKQVAASLGKRTHVLVVGPSTAKLAFLRFARAHDRGRERRIGGLETVDHPSNAQIVAFATRFFLRTEAQLANAREVEDDNAGRTEDFSTPHHNGEDRSPSI